VRVRQDENAQRFFQFSLHRHAAIRMGKESTAGR
jgi:hypothetical protein